MFTSPQQRLQTLATLCSKQLKESRLLRSDGTSSETSLRVKSLAETGGLAPLKSVKGSCQPFLPYL